MNEKFRILITGSRNHTSYKFIYNKIVACLMNYKKKPTECLLIHGGARGADSLANLAARHLDMEIKVFEADWRKYGKGAGSIRNHEMIKFGADVCLAFPLKGSKGTIHCISLAEAKGIPTEIFWEDS